jgi:acyl-CoA synthetase (AMP-forming)/AMP-acid ligase II
MMVTAIMRAGLVPFCISPRNAATGVADLLEKTGAAVVYVSADRKEILAEAFEIWGKQLPVFDALRFKELHDSSKELSESGPLPSLPTTMNLDSPGMILHSSGTKPAFLRISESWPK